MRFEIYYLVEREITTYNNTLYYATESPMIQVLAQDYGIEMEISHMDHLSCTRKEILNYNTNIAIQAPILREILDAIIYNIEEIRYIVLKKKDLT